MARKNRKKQRNGLILPVPFAGVVVLICTVGLSYTWLNCRCDALGEQITALETEIVDLEKQQTREEYRWMQLKSPQSIQRALARTGIAMTWPRSDQVVRLYEDPHGLTRQLAGGRTRALEYSGLHRLTMNE